MRALFACLLLALPATALADQQPTQPILLWGFQNGCNPLPAATREVQKELESTVTKPDANTYVLSPAQKLLGCHGPACAALVKRACPNAKGRVMGGLVAQNDARSLLRVRLWLHDLQTGQTAYHDNYCQNCTIASTLKINAVGLAQNPTFASAPGSTPLYCQPEAPMHELAPRSSKVFWTVFGKDINKEAVRTAVRILVQQTGTDVPFEHEGKGYSIAALRKIIAKEPGAQVFGAEIQGNGKIELFLYDGPTEQIETQRVECEACDKDGLIDQVKQTALAVLSHCFGDSCGRASRSRAPAEACRPFEVARCEGDEPIPLVPSTAESSLGTPSAPQSGPEISPRLAKLTLGVAWGFFAAGAATTAALLAANYAGAGQYQGTRFAASDTLLPTAGAIGGMSLLMLGAAIPTTIVINRASSQAQSGVAGRESTLSRTDLLSIQCPD